MIKKVQDGKKTVTVNGVKKIVTVKKNRNLERRLILVREDCERFT